MRKSEQKMEIGKRKYVEKNVRIEIIADSTPFSPENNLLHTDPKQLGNKRVISIIGFIDLTNVDVVVSEQIINLRER